MEWSRRNILVRFSLELKRVTCFVTGHVTPQPRPKEMLQDTVVCFGNTQVRGPWSVVSQGQDL